MPNTEAVETQHLQRAELSAEISRLVTRMLGGEAIDTAACGEELAEKYPEAELSGAMIAEAISNAAGMVGMIRDARTLDAPDTLVTQKASEAAFEELADAIEEDMSELVASRQAEAAERARRAAQAADGAQPAAAPPVAETKARPAPGIGGALAAVMRRAFARG